MGSQESGRLAASLVRRAGKNADAAQIADALMATLQEIEAVLTPIVGQRGAAALYKRSLYLASSTQPCLVGLHENVHAAMDLAPLGSALKQQGSSEASAGGDALLHTFYELLTSLVGPSLTERLLRSIWANSLSTSPAQDNKP